jgi:2-polyprenyl-3-methyl-5-hydroxy-6-metoxy-1,4-benzoquinol methylase
MDKSWGEKCPICQSEESEIILTLDCGNPDGSTLYPTVRLGICSTCGHAFNMLSHAERKALRAYYDAEYAPTNMNAIEISGDRPGSADSKTVTRYSQLFNLLSAYIHPQSEILDVGCAMGGLLQYLHEKGYRCLSGVEMTETYVHQAKKEGLFLVERGEAEELPFHEKMFDAIVMEQVIEHVLSPARSFREARRVLKKNGMLFIGVPDASRYSDFNYFDFYWVLLREHINHFDASHLEMLGLKNGFKMVEYRQSSHAVMSQKMVMPDVYAVFRVIDSERGNESAPLSNQTLRHKLTDYIAKECARQSLKKKRILELAKSGRPVYIWGIGREFFYLYESVGLRKCNIAGLIDKNPLKQKTFSIDGMRVNGEEILGEPKSNSILMIAAVAHAESIQSSARAVGYTGELFDLEQENFSSQK